MQLRKTLTYNKLEITIEKKPLAHNNAYVLYILQNECCLFVTGKYNIMKQNKKQFMELFTW